MSKPDPKQKDRNRAVSTRIPFTNTIIAKMNTSLGVENKWLLQANMFKADLLLGDVSSWEISPIRRGGHPAICKFDDGTEGRVMHAEMTGCDRILYIEKKHRTPYVVASNEPYNQIVFLDIDNWHGKEIRNVYPGLLRDFSSRDLVVTPWYY